MHRRQLTPIDKRGIIRPNRDTLYSFAVFDFDAGPVTVMLPDAGKRFMSMQVINEDHYTPAVYYGAGMPIEAGALVADGEFGDIGLDAEAAHQCAAGAA